jgi:hypothetical protein
MLKIIPGLDADAVRRSRRFQSYNQTVQDYGTFFAGFAWQIYGCGTYRTAQSADSARGIFHAFHRRLRASINSRIATIAVPERRFSGCGSPAIALHWHFVMSGPQHRSETLLKNAQSIWRAAFGDAKIEPYDATMPGAHYLAKGARQSDFDYLLLDIARLPYRGPDDLMNHSLTAPYVPEHVRTQRTRETRRLRNVRSL